MLTVRTTVRFQRWLTSLRDKKARSIVASPLDRMAFGIFGDTRSVGSGVWEARIHFGPGYRLYYCQKGEELVVVLAGGGKSSQSSDIAAAIRLKDDLSW
jgi:putative addiction module killer protein